MALKNNKMKFKPVRIKKSAGIDTNDLERIKFKIKKTTKKDYFLEIRPKSYLDKPEDVQDQIFDTAENRDEASIITVVERKQEFVTPHKNEWIFENENSVSKVIVIDGIEQEEQKASISKMFYLNKTKVIVEEEVVQKEIISTEDSNEATLEEYLSSDDTKEIPVVVTEEKQVEEQELGVFAVAPLSAQEMKSDDYVDETFILNHNNLVKEEEILEAIEQEEDPLIVHDENLEDSDEKITVFGEQTTEDVLNETETDNLDEEIEKIQKELMSEEEFEQSVDESPYLNSTFVVDTTNDDSSEQVNLEPANVAEPTVEELLFDTFVENEIKRQNQIIEEDNFYEKIINSLLE